MTFSKPESVENPPTELTEKQANRAIGALICLFLPLILTLYLLQIAALLWALHIVAAQVKGDWVNLFHA